ncbi:hypothetical protein TcCL_Unassigned03374 [Trypanosoma cruzi]|nr:hypothetical protein TcCL_Unassigned03374 [Trypanosoma cruzi]
MAPDSRSSHIVVRRPSALKSTWASHNVTSLINPCNAYIIDPYADTHQWRCSPERVNHRRHPRNCRGNNPENFWAGLVSHWEPCQLHQRAVLHAASKEMPSPRSNKDRKKDAFTSTQEAASAITGGK